ncbi:hypothetical protein KC929_00310 [Patescibacteria group bacterium]|nr:hypothetical protein [Patescibacteria group bacterium]
MKKKKVILYRAPSCDACDLAEKKVKSLAHVSVEIVEINPQDEKDSPEIKKEVVEKNGEFTLPVFKIDDIMYPINSEKELEEVIDFLS